MNTIFKPCLFCKKPTRHWGVQGNFLFSRCGGCRDKKPDGDSSDFTAREEPRAKPHTAALALIAATATLKGSVP